MRIEMLDKVKLDSKIIGSKLTFCGSLGNRLAGELWKRQDSEESEQLQPVLFLHGAGQTRHSWNETAKRLAVFGFDAITIDHRGHGDSDWVPRGNYSFDCFAKDVKYLTNALFADYGTKPIVVGASLGGIASMLVEGRYQPNSFKALVLVDITPRVCLNGVAKIIQFMGSQIETGFSNLSEAAEAISQFLPNRTRPKNLNGLKKNLRLDNDGRFRWHWDPNFIEQRTEFEIHRGLVEERIVNAAKRLKLPVLLIRGTNSDLVKDEHVKDFLKLVPNSSFTDVTGAGHMVMGDKNDAFAEALLEFIVNNFGALNQKGVH